jgi:hypothetical protein
MNNMNRCSQNKEKINLNIHQNKESLLFYSADN